MPDLTPVYSLPYRQLRSELTDSRAVELDSLPYRQLRRVRL